MILGLDTHSLQLSNKDNIRNNPSRIISSSALWGNNPGSTDFRFFTPSALSGQKKTKSIF